MDCKITSTKRHNRRWAFTLVELLVATAIGGIVLSAFAGLTFYTGRSFAALANYVELDAASRNALDRMSKEIRQTKRLISHSATNLVFEDFDGGALGYIYNEEKRTLVRSKNNVFDKKPLLTECNFLEFNIFQRNPVGGTYDQYPTASPSTCKLVQLRWVCSRDLVKARWNTESVQSARIVIRKQ